MAQTKSTKFNRPTLSHVDGRAVFLNDSITVSANPTAADTHDFRIPKGFEVSRLRLYVPDMDSSTGLAGKVGFAPIGASTVIANGVSSAGNDAYFAAAGAFGQTAGAVECDFPPITFEEDVYLRITWTVAASGTFTAGTIRSTMGGNCVGVGGAL
jgi:hypothetical protein